MRRKDREMDKNFSLSVIDSSPYGVLSAVDENLLPYCIPLSMARKGNTIYFHCAKEGRKLDILNSNPNVCISFVTDVSPVQEKYTTLYKSAVVKGKAVEITDKNEKKEGLKAITEKFAPDFMNIFDERAEQKLSVTSVWKVEMEEITGKGNI